MLCRKVLTVYFENHTELTNKLCGENTYVLLTLQHIVYTVTTAWMG